MLHAWLAFSAGVPSWRRRILLLSLRSWVKTKGALENKDGYFFTLTLAVDMGRC
jgi:hypothetical protein